MEKKLLTFGKSNISGNVKPWKRQLAALGARHWPMSKADKAAGLGGRSWIRIDAENVQQLAKMRGLIIRPQDESLPAVAL